MIWVGSKVTSEGWMLESANPEGDFRVIIPRREGVEYGAEHAVIGGEDRFLILHNDVVDGIKAENFVLVEAPVSDPTNMTTLIEHSADVRLEEAEAFAGHLVLSYRREALTRVAVWPLTDDGYGERHEIDFDEELFSIGMGSNPEWAQPTIRLGFTSFITPGQVYDYYVASGELALRKSQPVLGDFDASNYEQRRDWAVADDGTRIPLSIVRRVGAPEGPAPLLLYGYGSYEASIDPSFSVARLSLLDRGVVFVVAHVRGGGARWVVTGTKTARRSPRRTPSPILSLAQSI